MRQITFIILVTLLVNNIYSQLNLRYRGTLVGNKIVEFKHDSIARGYFYDPIDDTINFKVVFNNFYTDKSNKVYIKSIAFRPINSDTSIYFEYLKDVSDFIDLNTYKDLSHNFFINRNSVYFWNSNSDGFYPIQVRGADPSTFIPFDSIAGGKDKNHVFYGGPPEDFLIINNANPKTIQILNPKKGCWNCNNCYFVDDKNVFFGLNKIEGADSKSFRLLNLEKIDAEDNYKKYFEGKPIN